MQMVRPALGKRRRFRSGEAWAIMPTVASSSESDDDRRRHVQDRLEILDALITVLNGREHLLEVVQSASDHDDALVIVQREFGLNEVQAHAALDLQVRRFTRAQRQRITDEREQLLRELRGLNETGGG
ncbi:MAG TPA: DNA gyrase subunit A [Jatrophihabitans sp.]|nr:DNA gyrase subunit A [Jatrophihabitans sp.]